MESQILGNRYELIEKLGGGGMSVVYKARCSLLNRFVAVKILRPDFTNDEEFVKRFRIEAQSAASLSHPNIVPIYDVGNEGDIYYIIMECVDGITLKEYINEKGRLPWEEAVNIAIQICSAIKHAHKSHIVHRDIKPHNILLTKEGIAKVTDFGIARAVTSSTITMSGNTIGSVHYFSPEQARGGYTDEKSDLYSLGVVLYEMVTGRVPFDGDTPIAVALKHIQEKPKPPIEINTGIPAGLNDIIMRAMEKDQNLRYQTAHEFLQDLYMIANDPSKRFAGAGAVGDSPTIRVKTVSEEDVMSAQRTTKKNDAKKGKDNKDRATYWAAGIISVIIIAIFAYIGYRIVMPSLMTEKKDFIVGNYVGKNIEEVEEELTLAGIYYETKEEYSDTVDKGIIIDQSIDEGKPLNPGNYTPLVLTVSKGEELIEIQNLRNKERREAEAIIRDLDLVPEIQEQFDEDVPIDRVIKTDPGPDNKVKKGTTVMIYVSKGPEIKMTKVPKLIGKTMMEAKKLLTDANLKMGKILPEESSNYVDKIVDQFPAAGEEVKEGTAVDITFEEKKPAEPVAKTLTVPLADPDDYGDVIKVYIEAIPSDTNKAQVVMNKNVNKEEFPLNIEIPVPEGGYTKIRIYFDDILYNVIDYQYQGVIQPQGHSEDQTQDQEQEQDQDQEGAH